MNQPLCIPPPTQMALTGEPSQLLPNEGHLGVPSLLMRDGRGANSGTVPPKSGQSAGIHLITF